MLTHHDQIFPKVKFDIRVWSSSVEIQDCGTAACALGSACLYEPFRKQGLGLCSPGGVKVWPYLTGIRNVPGCDSPDGFEVGAAFFGISYSESKSLFNPGAYRGHHQPMMSRCVWEN